MAHELTHVKNRDTLISTVSASLAGAISVLANFGMLFGGRDSGERSSHALLAMAIMIVAPIGAMLIRMAISRAREFGADAGGAAISGDPLALDRALRRIDACARGVPLPTAEAHPETAQMMIVNALSGGGLAGLFSTHPTTEERIARLMHMSRSW
jgi:heat shock protein HtpX